MGSDLFPAPFFYKHIMKIKIPKSEYSEIVKKYDCSERSSSIAKTYGVSKKTINNILISLNLDPNKGIEGNCSDRSEMIPVHDRIRHCSQSKQWRNDCIERDEFCCQITGKQGKLQVHHLRSFYDIFDEFAKDYEGLDDDVLFDIAQDYEDFWDIDNGITLLVSTHNEFHVKFNDPRLAIEMYQFRNQGWDTQKIADHFNKDFHIVKHILTLIS